MACDRDLASGIQDTYPLPVYGVLNERPKGPCLDTLVPLDELEQAIVRFMEPGSLPATGNLAQAQASQSGLAAVAEENASGGQRARGPFGNPFSQNTVELH